MGLEGTDEQQRAAFMSALVTEHFVLQSGASTTVSESAGRASLYLSMLSSSLVATGFAAQSPRLLVPFAASVIPVVVLLGVFTTVRLVDTGVQNLQYLAGISRIREFFREIDPRNAHLFTAWGHSGADRTSQALASLALKRSPVVGLFTTASMVAAINSVVAGAGTVLACALLLGSEYLAVMVPVGVLAAGLFMAAFYRYQDRRYRALDAAWEPGWPEG